jgi:Asp-tRNA(Asn)/Glu-tRNA(Gln) amidotransferase A subunit family amidase
VTAEVRRALTAAFDALAAAGWELREIRLPWLSELPRWEQALAAIVASDAYQVHRGRDTGKYAAGTRALLEYGRSVTPTQKARAQADREILRAQVDASLAGRHGADFALLRVAAGVERTLAGIRQAP